MFWSSASRAIVLIGGFICMAAPVLAREWVDSTGKSRTEAELVAVRNGRVILEKPDGSIITVPLERLSPADQAFVKSQTGPTNTPERPTSAAPTSASKDGSEVAGKARAVLETSCHRCHGQEGTSEGGFNFVLNLEKLAETHVSARNPEASLLLERMTADDDSVMPPPDEEPRPTAADITLIRAWIEAGAPSGATEKPREFITNEQIVKHILADVRAASERSRRFLRYFTLTHLYNRGVSEDELQTFRNAFVKLINSLSWNTNLIIPDAVDPARTVYRIDIRQLNWSSEAWEAVENANPYFLDLNSADARACYEATETRMPYVRADWFVFAASKPPLYHTMLGIPDTDLELEQTLKVNVAANIEQEQVIRAGFNRSGVSQNNRLIEWHKSPYGSYWKSYDFGGNTGQQNLFAYPLGPDNSSESFRHDGGEIIFTLPNGLQGYMLSDGNGRRIDKGPVEIVSDPKRPDKSVTNGVSCMSCHYTGVINKTDEIGVAIRANPKAFDNSDYILALYREPAELDEVFQQDAQRFAAAMEKIGITSLSRSGEPVSAMAARFEEELDLKTVACEFGLSTEEFEKRLKASDAMARFFGPLRTAGGTIKRDVFASMFGDAAIEFRLTLRGRAEVAASVPREPARSNRPTGSSSRPTARSGAGRDKPTEVQRFPDLGWGVQSLAFSPSGELLAAGKMDRAVMLFNVKDGARLDVAEKLENLGQVTSAEFTPDGSKLLTGGYSGQITVWEVSKEGRLKPADQFVAHSKEINCIAVSGDSRFAVSGGAEKKLRYWEIDGGNQLAEIPGFEGPVKACHISQNGRIAMATDGAILIHINLKSGEVTKRIPLARSWASGQAAAFSPDGNLLAAGDSYNIRIWQTQTGRELPKFEDNEIAWSIAFTPDKTRLVTGTSGKVNVWSLRKQHKIHSLPLAGGSYVQCMAVSPDSKQVAAIPSSAGQDLQVFQLPADK